MRGRLGDGIGRRAIRGAAAGALAAGVWSATEPIAERALGTGFTDTRLLGRWIAPSGPWQVAGLAAHIANGAAFGAAYGSLGLRGVRSGVAAAMLEYVASWPGMAVADRLHPDRRAGTWPPLLTNGRVAAQEAVMHLVFGLVIGAASARLAPSGPERPGSPGDADQGAKTAP